MSSALANTGLIAHREALAAAGVAIKLVLRLPTPLKPIADQAPPDAGRCPLSAAAAP